MDKVKITHHKEICEKLTKTYEAKNADYGDSFSETRKKYPEAICIRLLDKMNRLENLISGQDQKVDESIDDTLLDIANYAVMELVERRYDSEEEVKPPEEPEEKHSNPSEDETFSGRCEICLMCIGGKCFLDADNPAPTDPNSICVGYTPKV